MIYLSLNFHIFMASDFFTTKHGNEIKIIPEYFNAHNINSANDVLEGDTIYFKKKHSLNELFTGFFKDFYKYSVVLDFLKSNGLETHWDATLDIGGQEGYVSRFLHGEGRANTADCVEIKNYENVLDNKKMNWLYNRYKIWRICKKIGLDYKSKISKVTKALDAISASFGYYPSSNSSFYNLKFTEKPEISNYIIGDILKLNKKYDFISSILSLEYFDHRVLFKKVSELLNEHGVFVFLVNYWWFPVNSTRLVGNFPYACQRLEKDDFIKYLKQFHATDVEDSLKTYDYFGGGIEQKPTLTQYIQDAEKNDLQLISSYRFIPVSKNHTKTPLAPTSLDNLSDFTLDEVLKDIHHFRSDVSLEDLKTAFVMAIFIKKDKPKDNLDSKIKQLTIDGYGSYQKRV